MVEHPGIRLREGFLDPLGLTASALARGLGVSRSTVTRLLAGDLPLSVSLAARLGAFFQVPARWFLDMQTVYDAARIEGDPTLAAGVAPWEPDPDVLLTPRGVMSLVDAPEGEAAGSMQQRELENGAVMLEGPR